MSSKDSETTDPHRSLLNLIDKINLRRSQTLAFTIHEKILNSHTKIKNFTISATTWNEEFELPDGSHSVSDIQDYFENTLKNMEKRLIILQ